MISRKKKVRRCVLCKEKIESDRQPYCDKCMNGGEEIKEDEDD